MIKYRQTLSLLKTYAKLPEPESLGAVRTIADRNGVDIPYGSKVKTVEDPTLDVPFTIETYIPTKKAFSELFGISPIKKYIKLIALYNPKIYQKEIENPTLAYRRKLACDIIAYGSLRYTSYRSVIMGFFSFLGMTTIGKSALTHTKMGKFRGFYVVILLCSIIIAFGILPTLLKYFNSATTELKHFKTGILAVKKTPQDLYKLPSKIEAKLKNFKQAIESRKTEEILMMYTNQKKFEQVIMKLLIR